MRTQTEFLKYVKSFYGRGGIYAEFFATNPPERADYVAAYKHLLAMRAAQGIEFDGDSFDREVMRDILFVRMGILTPEQCEYKVEV
jgi:hypothetical protein